MIHRRSKPAGFILLTALLMLAIVGAAVAMTAMAASAHLLHQANDLQQAQLDQLLLAGAREAVVRLNFTSSPDDNAANTIELPGALGAQHAHLTVQFSSGGSATRTATIVASLGRHAASQIVQLDKSDGNWRMSAAELR